MAVENAAAAARPNPTTDTPQGSSSPARPPFSESILLMDEQYVTGIRAQLEQLYRIFDFVELDPDYLNPDEVLVVGSSALYAGTLRGVPDTPEQPIICLRPLPEVPDGWIRF
jgi:hypothetical protein